MRGVLFGTKHSYDDFGLILSKKSIPLPSPKIIKVDVRGSDGSLDLSTVITGGDVKYENRTLEFVFTAIGDWETAKHALAAHLHGRRMNIVLDNDPTHYFVGRASIDSFKENRATAEIVVTVDAEPWRYEVAETSVTLSATATEKTATLSNLRRWVVPTFTCSAAATITYDGTIYQLQAGESVVPAIMLKEGNNPLKYKTASGTATVTVKYRKAIL